MCLSGRCSMCQHEDIEPKEWKYWSNHEGRWIYTSLKPDGECIPLYTTPEAVNLQLREEIFEEVAQWHDKNARICLEVSKDDPRMNADDRRRAHDAYRHHAASAAAIRNKLVGERRAHIFHGDKE